jgi:PAS domain S-box-containing protein
MPRQQYAFYRATLDSLDEHIAVLDAAGTTIGTNAALDRFVARNPGCELRVGVNYLAACETASAEERGRLAIACALREMLAGTTAGFTAKYEIHSDLGASRWFGVRATRFRGGGPGRVVLQHYERTDFVIGQRLARLRARLLDEIDAAVIGCELDGTITVWSRGAEDLYGWSAAEVVGRNAAEVVEARSNHGASRFGPGAERDLRRKDGSIFSGDLSSVVYRDEHDEPAGIISVTVDATERIRAAGELRQARDHLRAVTGSTSEGVCTHDVRDLHQALEEQRFELYAQPILDLRTGATTSHELLLRMRERDGTMRLPGTFLPTAERSGLIRELDRWVIRQAARLAGQGHRLELNLSALSLSDPSLYDDFAGALADSGARPGHIVIELTETAVMQNEMMAAAFVERVAALGCALALDDFGTGFGGFSYLKRLPVDFLKIDTEFVRDLRTNHASRHVVQAVVGLAGSFGYKTVAEGVEDGVTFDLIREMGGDYAQGFGIGPPAPLEDTLYSGG